MRIALVTPAPRGSRTGNRTTAVRWARILRGLGHEVSVSEAWRGGRCDLLVAVHARKSAPSVLRFRAERPEAPVILCLAGTDLYRDIRTSAAARRALEAATRLVLLQPEGASELPARLRRRARVILQSAERPPAAPRRSSRTFDVAVLAHLRPVKDPLRAALASRRLPEGSRVRVLLVGGAISTALAARARAEEKRNPRFRWLGELPRWKARRVLARSRLLSVTSRTEGGANVVSEAIACGVPVVASRIPGNVGLLGRDYPGYFPRGDTAALAALLARAEADPEFLRRLERACRRLAPGFRPGREREAWRRLLEEIGPSRRV